MALRKDLEDQIAAKLASLSNEDAQRIAEDYVRIRYPDRFPYFGFRAFSPEGKSRSGWPDASSIGADGRIEGVEATHTASRAGVVKHLEEYLDKAKALELGQLGGFIHVSVSPKASFPPEEIKSWTDKFVAAGFARDKVELVFGQSLVLALTGPEFARTRIEVLGIPDLPTHFRLYRSKIGPDEERLGVSFIPNWEDFEKGRVHRPEAAAVVAERLDRDRIALVRGIGASGKTVLAWLLAQDVVKRGLPAFSFDFAEHADLTSNIVNELTGDLKRLAHPDVLLVLDNIHLDETRTKELYLAWEEIPPAQRPRLLLVGRETRTAKGSAIASLELEAVPLRARQAELRGVMRRLALREHEEDQLPEPPEAELTNWLRAFGGNPEKAETTADLIVFSAAVARRMRDLRRGRWELTQKDAVEQVKEVYLSKLSQPERQNLIRLCVAEEFEVGVQTEALADKSAALTRCNVKLGIVFRDEFGSKQQYVRYRLVHAALGELLLSGVEETVDHAALRLEMTLAAPVFGCVMAARMVQAGRLDGAKALMAELIARPDSLLTFESTLVLNLALRLAGRLGIELPNGFGEALASDRRARIRLTDIALQTQLHFLTGFLRYAEEIVPAVFAALSIELAAEKNRDRLVEITLQTPLGSLVSFLAYADKALPSVFAALSTELAAGKNRARLVETTLQTPLDDLANFLGYAERALPQVFAALSAELAVEKNRRRLAEVVLRNSLDHLAHFLAYAKKALPPVFAALSTELAAEKNRSRLFEISLRTQPHYLANFLDYAEDALPLVFAVLSTEFAAEKNLTRLVEISLRTSLDHLASFLGYAEKALPLVFAAVSTELAAEKNHTRLVELALQTPLGSLVSFLDYAKRVLPQVFEPLSTGLAAEENLIRLTEIALRTPLDHLASFLRNSARLLPPVDASLRVYFSSEAGRKALAVRMLDAPEDKIASVLTEGDAADVWRQAFLEIDLQDWRNSRKNGPPPRIDAFVNLQGALFRLGRAEFASAPADLIIVSSSHSDWNQAGLGLHHLSHVLRLATKVTEDQQGDFVARVAKPDWLDFLYGSVPAGGLAGNLFAISKSLPVHLCRHFDRKTLRDRISGELRKARDSKSRAAALSLWGAASLLGAACDTRGIVWPDARDMEQMLRLRAPPPASEAISHMDIQLWLGLRLMAAELTRPPPIPAELGSQVLALWETAQAAAEANELSQKVVEVNATMIPWLRACRSSGWLLLPPAAASPG